MRQTWPWALQLGPERQAVGKLAKHIHNDIIHIALQIQAIPCPSDAKDMSK
jgi:hypothetical protein